MSCESPHFTRIVQEVKKKKKKSRKENTLLQELTCSKAQLWACNACTHEQDDALRPWLPRIQPTPSHEALLSSADLGSLLSQFWSTAKDQALQKRNSAIVVSNYSPFPFPRGNPANYSEKTKQTSSQTDIYLLKIEDQHKNQTAIETNICSPYLQLIHWCLSVILPGNWNRHIWNSHVFIIQINSFKSEGPPSLLLRKHR